MSSLSLSPSVALRSKTGGAPASNLEQYLDALSTVGELIAHWPMDDSSADFSSNGGVIDTGFLSIYGVDATATIAGGTTVNFAVADGDNPFSDDTLGVLEFATTNSNGLGFPEDPSIGPGAAHTVIGWMKPASDNTVVKFWQQKDASPADGIELGTNVYPAPLALYAWSGGSFTPASGDIAGAIPIRGAWNMIAYTYNGSGTAKVYLNGVLVATVTSLVVGNRNELATHGRVAKTFKGRMCQFSYHDQVVAAADIASLYAIATAA